MSRGPASLVGSAQDMRQAFDRTFAESARRDSTPMESLVAFRLGSAPYALRLSEIAGLFVDRKITPFPGGSNAMLGLAGFRGAIVPVYDLGAMLGHSSGETPRWLAIASGAPVAFALEAFDGHLHVPSEAIAPRAPGDESRGLVRDFVMTGGLVRPIVSVPLVLDLILKQLPGTTLTEER